MSTSEQPTAILAAMEARTITCAHTGETLVVHPSGYVLLNPHNHSNRSDGRDDPLLLSGYAVNSGVNLALTDHNLPPEPRGGTMPPGLVAGMEVCTREHVDLVVLGSLLNVHGVFRNAVERTLHRRNPRYYPTGVPIRTLVDAVREQGCHCLHPHYANPEGLSILPPQEQTAVLEASGDIAFLEVNALQSDASNALSRRVAEEWGLPVLAAGDTHRDEDQHAGTHTGLPLPLLADGPGSLVGRLLSSLHARPDALRHTLRPASVREKLRTGLQVLLTNGIGPLSRYAGKTVGRFFGLVPRADGTVGFPSRAPSRRASAGAAG